MKCRDANLGEKIAAWVVTNAIKMKRKLGMGLKMKPKKGKGVPTKHNKKYKRIISVSRKRGFLSLFLPMLSAVGGLGGGAAGISKAVNEASKQQLTD